MPVPQEGLSHDLLVLGAGPGGYVAALRGAQLGLKVASVDENELLGGTCLRIGCIPSKALLESSEKFVEARHSLAAHGVQVGGVRLDLAAMLHRKEEVVQGLCRGIEGLYRKSKVTRYRGRGRFDGPSRLVVEGPDGQTVLGARWILIATGSVPATISGVELDGDRIGTSTEALSYPEVPRRLMVIGGGYIGLELGSVWNRLGSEVTVLEALDRVLPEVDRETAGQAQKIFEKQGLRFRLGSRVRRAVREGDECVVECEGQEPIRCDRVLLAVGRKPNTASLGLETLGIRPDPKGFIPVDENFATTAQGVYAVGDCIGSPMLAHKASDEAVACVDKLVTGYGHVNYQAIPAVIFTHPEIAGVGATEEALKSAGVEFRKGVFPFRANGRARTLAETDGGVKILSDARTDRILGVHILGPRAGDLIAEAAAAMEFGASSEDLFRTSHAHPTLAEALREAALAVEGKPLHL
jgi:dihydrolipoamide dehydrogenase